MKNQIIKFVLVFTLIIGGITIQSCNSNQTSDSSSTTKETPKSAELNNEDAGLTAYYFHATRRCETCEAVEKVSKETIAADYKGKVTFKSINREKESDNPLVLKYEISGQTLLLIKGDQAKDMTSAAFMYARNNPEKFEEKLKSAIDEML